MFFDKFNSVLMNLQLSYHLHELLFLFEAFKNFSLIERDRDDALPLFPKNFFVFFDDIDSIFEFLYFVSSLVYFIYFYSVVYRYGL